MTMELVPQTDYHWGQARVLRRDLLSVLGLEPQKSLHQQAQAQESETQTQTSLLQQERVQVCQT